MKAPSGEPASRPVSACRGHRLCRPRPVTASLCGGLVAVLTLVAPLAVASPPQVRPLSAAEGAAVGLVARLLDEGPQAWLEELASDAPLRGLPPAEARAEIAARVGPPEGATWWLQTPGPGLPASLAVFAVELASGVDDLIVLDLVDQAGSWKIRHLSCLVEARPAGSAGAAEASVFTVMPSANGAAVLLLVLLLALLLALAFRWTAGAAGWPRRLAAAVLGVAMLGCPGGGRSSRGLQPEISGPLRLAALLPLRQAIATGVGPEEVRALIHAASGASEAIRQAADAWEAQYHLTRLDLVQAEAILTLFPFASDIALVELCRGRLAFLQGFDTKARLGYEKARGLIVDHDGVRLEEAEIDQLLGADVAAQAVFAELSAMGSRAAEVYYELAARSVIGNDLDEAEQYLRTAWSARPLSRRELLADPLLSFLLARPRLAGMVQIGAAEEPRVEAEDTGPVAFSLPDSARARTNGGELELSLSRGVVVIAGGASAVSGAELEDAETWSRRRGTALADRLLGDASLRVAAVAQPRLRRGVLQAATALAGRGEWNDLVRLTTDLAKVADRAPPLLIKLRAVALERTFEHGEARRLLVGLARRDLAGDRRDPGTLYQLAHLLVAGGDLDLGIRLIEKANLVAPYPISDAEVRRLELERDLLRQFESRETTHFVVRYPRARCDPYTIDEIGRYLEGERQRLRRWIPLESRRKFDVVLLPVDDFATAFGMSGLAVLGVYDGKIRLPFAELRRLGEEARQVLTHELAHAMLTEATADGAPSWLQEGLAQHVEGGRTRLNPFPDLLRQGRVVALSLLDAVLASGEPQLVDLAYGEALWVVRYLEDQRGRESIRRLVASLGKGATEGEALAEALGSSWPELQAAVLSWAANEAPVTWRPKRTRD